MVNCQFKTIQRKFIRREACGFDGIEYTEEFDREGAIGFAAHGNKLNPTKRL